MLTILVQLLLTAIDVIIFYLITYALLNKKFEFSFKTELERKRMIRTYGSGIVAMIAINLSFFIGGVGTHQFVSILIIIALIKIISRIRFHYVISIYSIAFVIFGLTQALTIPLFSMFNIDLTNLSTFVLGQAFSLISIWIICYKVKPYKIIWFLERKPALRLSVFILTSIFLIVFFFITYEETLVYVPYYVLFLGLLIIALLQVLLGTDQRLNPEQILEIKEIDIVKQELVDLIDMKRHQAKQNIIVDRINYISHHVDITESQLSKLLELLLGHAVIMQKDYPIIIGISVIYDQLQLIIKHECSQHKYKALKNENTIKGIKKIIRRYKGSILLQHTYEQAYNAHYAIIIVKI